GGRERGREGEWDVVPGGEGGGGRLTGRAMGFDEIVERGVGEDHPEAEGVVGAIALEDGDVVGRIGLLHQQGEVQPGRTAADRDDPHSEIVPKARGDAWAADAV